jgi:dihydrofolate reductase
MQLSFIVAIDQNWAIGLNNQLPWHMPADLQYFKAQTVGKPIIMGRKTFDSIGKPLPKRRNIIITRDKNYTAQGCEIYYSPEAALAAVEDEPEAMVVGGANLFRTMLPNATRLYLTTIHHSFEADTFLDKIELSAWNEVSCDAHKADAVNPFDYTYWVYER